MKYLEPALIAFSLTYFSYRFFKLCHDVSEIRKLLEERTRTNA
jgi:hypothetical protein